MKKKSEVIKPENQSELELESKPVIKEGGEPSPAESNTGLDSIADNLSASMPEAQEHTIEEEKRQLENKQNAFSQYVDNDGNKFDPAVHKTDKDGNPTISPKGKLIKKPGRKAGQSAGTGVSASGSRVGGAPSVPDISEQQKRAQSRYCGVAMANTLIQVCTVFGGDDWRPLKDEQIGLNEKENLEEAFGNYAEYKQWTDFPPGIALTVAILGYMAPRFNRPATKERASRFKNIVGKWWMDRKVKKDRARAQAASASENKDTQPKSTLEA